jgi:uncharacterized protein (TIGR02145 family)
MFSKLFPAVLTFSLGTVLFGQVTDGLVAHYQLDGNAIDASTFSNNGVVNGAIAIGDRFGNSSAALDFDGTLTDYVTIDETPSLQLEEITFSVWVLLEAPGRYNIITKSHYDDATNEQFALSFLDSVFEFGIKRESSCLPGIGWQRVKSRVMTEYGSWVFVVGTWDGLTEKIYFNGQIDSTNTNVPSGPIDQCLSSQIRIGRHWASDELHLDGSLDDVRLFNRALSATEIDTLYHLDGWDPNGETMTDIDGNVYETVQIGEQTWMAENLKVTHYRNGNAIPKVTDSTAWANLSSSGFCNYDNNDANADIYGSLYNGYAVNDNRNIAPPGWHIPSDDEWKELEMAQGMSQTDADAENWRGTNEGSKLAGNADLWTTGSLENDAEFGNSGFNALPSGYRHYDPGNSSGYFRLGDYAYFRNATEVDNNFTGYRLLHNGLSSIQRSFLNPNYGFSIRCVKNDPEFVEVPLNLIATPTGGVVILDWDGTGEIDLVKYKIYRGIETTAYTLIDSVTTGSPITSTYTDNNVTHGTTYYYSIKAVDTDGNTSAYSNVDSATPYETLTDIDGNVYETVQIGDQTWMAENLRVTHYRDGTSIPNVTDNSSWGSLTTEAYCIYNNNTSNEVDAYGALYNGYSAINTRNIAPEGWHVPSEHDWRALEMELGMSQSEAYDIGYRGTNEGSKLAGNAALWNDGALENDSLFGYSGFAALPGGFRSYIDGSSSSLGYTARFWTTNDTNNTYRAASRGMYDTHSEIFRFFYDKSSGFSIRCVKDDEILVQAPQNLNATTEDAQVTLDWDDTGEADLAKYRIYRGLASTVYTLMDSVTSGSPINSAFTDNNVVNGTTYYYAVRAVNDTGNDSDYSNEVNVTLPIVYSGPLWHVSTTGSNQTGSGSYELPFASIQHGIDASQDGDTVLVQPGTYLESINFQGKNIVVGSLLLTTGNPTYLQQTVINAGESPRAVEFSSGEDSTAALIGFTILNGSTQGIFCENSSPTIQTCIVSQSLSHERRGIWCYTASPRIDDVLVTNNNGIGIWIGYEAHPVITNSTSSHNDGAGIYCTQYSNPTFTNVISEGNSDPAAGGGFFASAWCNPVLKRVIIRDNQAGYNGGGGIYLGHNSSVTLDSSLVSGNSSTDGGGAIRVVDGSILTCTRSEISNNSSIYEAGSYFGEDGSTATFDQCTLYGGGIYLQGHYLTNTYASFTNSILWECDVHFEQYTAASLLYSALQGGPTGDISGLSISNLISDNPLFYDTNAEDFSLTGNSPCIDTGNPSSHYDPDGTIADMGAYYYHHTELGENVPDSLWTRMIWSTGSASAGGVLQATDGGLLVYGSSSEGGSTTGSDVVLRKYSQSGEALWSQVYGGPEDDISASICETSVGDLYIFGSTQSYGAGFKDAWLIKTDSGGNEIWNQTYGSEDYEWGSDILLDGPSLVLLIGSNTNGDIGVIKTDTSGNEIWTRYHGGLETESGRSIVSTIDGGYAIIGHTESFGSGSRDIYLLKLDGDGFEEWHQTYGEVGLEYGGDLLQVSDGSFVICGYTQQGTTGDYLGWLIKTDNSGDILWNRTFVTGGHNIFRSLVQTSDGGYAIIGEAHLPATGPPRTLLLKTDSDGIVEWEANQLFQDNNWGIDLIQTGNNGYLATGVVANPGHDVWSILFEGDLMPTYAGPIWHVSTSGSDENGDGSPDSPFATIQNGINISQDGDTVLVEPGTYFENINFNGKNIVVSSLEIVTNDTSYISSTIIDGNQTARVATFTTAEDSTAVLNGLTVYNGNNNSVSNPDIKGGGIYCENASPTLSKLRIIGNTAHFGGGLYLDNSNSRLINLEIVSNTADTDGGGLYLSNCTNVRIENSSISNNTANMDGSGGNGFGGGVKSWQSDGSFINVIIGNNEAFQFGGGIYLDDSSPILLNVFLIDNLAANGGGLYCLSLSDPILTEVVIKRNLVSQSGGGIYIEQSNPHFNQCLVSDNIASTSGGGFYISNFSNEIEFCEISRNESASGAGIYISNNEGTIPQIQNCTIVNNTVTDGDDRSAISGIRGSITNSIIWGNSGGEGAVSPPEEGYHTFTYSDIQVDVSGIGNINSEPLFEDSEGDDYSLSELSPCIDAGNPDSEFNDSDGSRNDMGAYPYQLNPAYEGPIWYVATDGSDETGDGSVDSPYLTIQQAMSASSQQDIVLLHPGNYTLEAPIVFPDFQISILSSEGSDSTKIIGSPSVELLTTTQSSICLSLIRGITFEGFRNVAQGVQYLPRFSICKFSNNPYYQQGLFNLVSSDSVAQFDQCVFVNNTAVDFATNGLFTGTAIQVDFINSSFAQNSMGILTTYMGQVHFENCILRSSLGTPNQTGETASYSFIEYPSEFGNPGLMYECIDGQTQGSPGFISEEDGNLMLLPNSICIDVGNPDLDGDGSTWETDIDDQDPDGTRLDMGAFYFDQSNLSPIISVFPDSLGFTVNVAEGIEQSQPLTIFNTGTSQLDVLVYSSPVVSDIDGNTYSTVQIGDQVWMAENLKVTHYRDGSEIPYSSTDGDWTSTSGTFCFYNYDGSNESDTYGALYNWYAATDPRQLAPSGWHVATDQEWQILGDYLGGYAVAGGKMKEVGTAHWDSPNDDATNESRFNGLPGGQRHFTGGYYQNIGSTAYFWTATEGTFENALNCRLSYGNPNLSSHESYMTYGFSVRCVWDGDINLTSWLASSPDTLTISPGESADVLVSVSAEDLDLGDYSEMISIISNDPTNYTIDIPVTMNVISTHSGPVWHVSTEGSDDTGVGSEGSPFATIQFGIDASQSGDTVLVQPGTYVESVNYNGKNVVLGSLALISEDPSYINQTIIDGNQAGSVITMSSGEDSTACIIGFTIRNGLSGNGGGINCYNASPRILNCRIIGNTASNWGGGLCFDQNAQSQIENCVIDSNTANYGGGIFCEVNSDIVITDVIIRGNVANNLGGGFYCTEANPKFERVLVEGNNATAYGGVYFHGTENTETFLNKVTIVNNVAVAGGGLISSHANTILSVNNCIIWGNSPDQVYEELGSLTINYSDVQNGWEGIGNLDSDPLFVDAEVSNFHLESGSPCIDSGDPTSELDHDDTRVDMGAYFYDQRINAPQISVYPDSINFTVNLVGDVEQVQTIEISNDGLDPLEVQISISDSIATDVDGNIYQTIKIGNQVWMSENLKVTHYRNGDTIPNVLGSVDWMSTTSGAFSIWDDNDNNEIDTYGALYNGYAVGDSRNIAPYGWRIPSDSEWQVLVDYLGGDEVAGGKMKQSGTTLWESPNFGATNESGFTALPAGFRNFDDDGDFWSLNQIAYFWSASEIVDSLILRRGLYYHDSNISNSENHKKFGFSVRCIQDFWLDVALDTLSIFSGTSVNISITASGEGLSVGEYSDFISISSNDPTNNFISVPVTMNVISEDMIPPVVEFMTPTITEPVKNGDTLTVSWSATDNISLDWAKLWFSSDGGQSFMLSDSIDGDIPSIDWIAPDIISSDCSFAIWVSDTSGNIGTDTLRWSFSIDDGTPPTITVLTPIVSFTIPERDTLFVSWEASDNVGIECFDLFYYNDPTSMESSSFNIPGSERSFSFEIPSPGVSDSAQIRIEVLDLASNTNYDYSDYFSVTDNTRPEISHFSIPDTLDWGIGSVMDIGIVATDNVEITGLDLNYTTDDGVNWLPIIEDLYPVQGRPTYSWLIPDIPGECLVRAIVSDAVGLTDTSYSEPFNIYVEYPRIIASLSEIRPNGDMHLRFSQRMDSLDIASGTQVIGSVHGTYEIEGSLSGDDLTISSPDGFVSLDTLQVVLTSSAWTNSFGYELDGNGDGIYGGDNSDNDTSSTLVTAAGDYDQNGVLDFDDFDDFVIAWNNNVSEYELAPHQGEIPFINIQPDSSFDIFDLATFASMWNWAAGISLSAPLTESYLYEEVISEQNGNELEVSLPLNDYVASQTIFKYDPDVVQILVADDGLAKVSSSALSFVDVNSDSGFILITSSHLTESIIEDLSLKLIPDTKQKYSIEIAFQGSDMDANIIQKRSLVELLPIPTSFSLSQNYPNPFNASTTIEYGLPRNSDLSISIYDIRGRFVKEIYTGNQLAGYHFTQWNADNDQGQNVASGLYFIVLNTPEYRVARKALILK